MYAFDTGRLQEATLPVRSARRMDPIHTQGARYGAVQFSVRLRYVRVHGLYIPRFARHAQVNKQIMRFMQAEEWERDKRAIRYV